MSLCTTVIKLMSLCYLLIFLRDCFRQKDGSGRKAGPATASTSALSPPSDMRRHPMQVEFILPWQPEAVPLNLELTPNDHVDRSQKYPSFDDYEYYPVERNKPFRRDINPADDEEFNHYRGKVLRHIDVSEMEERFESTEDLEAEEATDTCRRTSLWSKSYYTCNSIHDLTMGRSRQRASNDFTTQYLGHGHFRDAFKLNGSGTSMDFVVKQLRLNDHRGGLKDMHLVARDATVMERLSASPNIVNIYGFCGTTILSEVIQSEVWRDIIPNNGLARQKDLDKEEQLTPRNNFTPEEKLQMSLEMAEGLADLHGFHEGVIFHGDTHPEQWLRAKDGSLKLNDFNNGVIMDYSPEYNTYCKPFRDFGGFYRSPEEFVPTNIGEQADTYSMGNNIYCLLTGLWPFYDETPYHSSEEIRGMIVDGKRPYVDKRWNERSYAESRLVDIMKQSWEPLPHNRISIFRMVELLKDAIAENDRRRRHHDGKV